MVHSDDAPQSKTVADDVLKVVQSQNLGTCRVGVRGDVDLATVSRLRDVLEGIFTNPEPPQSIVVDLRAVAFIDSAGLALLVDMRNRFGSVAPLSIVIRKGSQPDRVFKLGQFDRFITTQRDEANLEAVATG